LLSLGGIRRLALVTPYTSDVQQRIVDNYRNGGVEIVAERHLGICVNHDFALVEPEQLSAMMREVAGSAPQAMVTYCTNLRAAQLAAPIERELDIPLLDTVSTTIWGMLRAIGVSPSSVRGWGRMFDWA
jgi:maleate isomerase